MGKPKAVTKAKHGSVVRADNGTVLHLPHDVARAATSGGGTYLQSPRAPSRTPPARESAVTKLRADGLTGDALVKRLKAMGYNTSGFGG